VTSKAIRPVELERLTARAWRAPREESLGEWRLNAALGVSRRINSCWPLGDPGLDPDRAIAAVEAWYSRQNLPAVFKVAPRAVWPADLCIRLEARGYRADTETLLMTSRLRRAPDMGVTLIEEPNPRFEAVFAATAAGPGDARERLEALARTPRPRAFGSFEIDGVTAAIGACAMEAPWVGVFAMRTLPQFRCQGLAGRVLSDLLAWGADRGAQHAWLQVEAANLDAVRLYDRVGFLTQYSYAYWRKPHAA
jgi:GNAT superfamily N-acetyltransferase